MENKIMKKQYIINKIVEFLYLDIAIIISVILKSLEKYKYIVKNKSI